MATLCQYSVEGLCCICITTGCIQAPSVCGTHYGSGANLTTVNGAVPTGGILWAATGCCPNAPVAPPTGFVCTGTVYAQSSYPTLYSCVGLVTSGAGRGSWFANCCYCIATLCSRTDLAFTGYLSLCWTMTGPNLFGSMSANCGHHHYANFCCTGETYLIRNIASNSSTGYRSAHISRLCNFGALATAGVCCVLTSYLPYACSFSNPSYGACGSANCAFGSDLPNFVTDHKCRALFMIGAVGCGLGASGAHTVSRYDYFYTNNSGVNWTYCTSISCPALLPLCCLPNQPTSVSWCTCVGGPTCTGTINTCITSGLTWYDQKCDLFVHIPLVKVSRSTGDTSGFLSCCGSVAGKNIYQSSDLVTWTAGAAALSVFNGLSFLCTSANAQCVFLNECKCCQCYNFCTVCQISNFFTFIPCTTSAISCFDPVSNCSYLYYPKIGCCESACIPAPGTGFNAQGGCHHFMSYDLSTNCFIGWPHVANPITVFNGKLYAGYSTGCWCGVSSSCVVEYDLTAPNMPCFVCNCCSVRVIGLGSGCQFLDYEALFKTRCIGGALVGVHGGVTSDGLNFTGSKYPGPLCRYYDGYVCCISAARAFIITSSGCMIEQAFDSAPGTCYLGQFGTRNCYVYNTSTTFEVFCNYSLYDFNKATNFRTPYVGLSSNFSNPTSEVLVPFIKS